MIAVLRRLNVVFERVRGYLQLLQLALYMNYTCLLTYFSFVYMYSMPGEKATFPIFTPHSFCTGNVFIHNILAAVVLYKTNDGVAS